MATLVEGREYGLSSNISNCGNKTYIHFKLTDSAVRALEEYSKIKVGCSRTPTIQFNGSNGVMRIPAQASSDDPKAERNFYLSLTKVIGDDNGSFDCVQQIANRPSGSSLQCLGSMQYKVSTNANNEVYNDTRKKITQVDSELKKSCAKEIKMSGRFSGKKIRQVIPSSSVKAMQSSKPPAAPRATPPSVSTPIPTSASHHSISVSNSRLTPPPSSGHSPHGPAHSSHNGIHPNAKPLNGVVKPVVHHGGKPSSGIMSLPYRDRVIHLLALRPYKKPELLARLMKDGIREKDRNSLGSVLKQVSTMHKDNSYSLARHLWQEVRPDWKYYTEADRQLLKKNQQQMESRVSPSVSPAVTHPESPPSPQKRSTEDVTEPYPSKKQRISHHDKNQISTKVTNGLTGSQVTSSVHHKEKPALSSAHVNSASVATKVNCDSKSSPLAESPGSNAENQEKDADSLASTTNRDYMLQYRSLEDWEQRNRYKQDFNEEYAEYLLLHEKLQNVARRFQHLRERINNTKEGTQDYEALKTKVLMEYEQQRSDAKYQERKRRMDYLHEKLGHIKRMIQEFDQRQQVSTCS